MEFKVYIYLSGCEPKVVLLVNTITANENYNGDTHILRVNQALGIPYQDQTLIFTFQMSSNGFIADYFPCKFETKGRRVSHSVVCP